MWLGRLATVIASELRRDASATSHSDYIETAARRLSHQFFNMDCSVEIGVSKLSINSKAVSRTWRRLKGLEHEEQAWLDATHDCLWKTAR